MLRLMPTRKNSNALVGKEDIFDHFFDDFFAPLDSIGKQLNSFKVDVIETPETYVIKADLPGFNKEDLHIEYNNNYLSISATCNEYLEENKAHYVRRERQYGAFKRSFYIEHVALDDVEALFEKGVLTITVRKENVVDPKKTIEIK